MWQNKGVQQNTSQERAGSMLGWVEGWALTNFLKHVCLWALLDECTATLPRAGPCTYRQPSTEIHRDLALGSIPFIKHSRYLMGLGSNIHFVKGAHIFSMTYPRPDTP